VICPKCQNVMQTVDRRGVHIDQCQECRGIFLDRGELEQIVNAEQSYYGPPVAAPPPYRPDSYGPGAHRSDSPPPYPGGHSGHRDSPPPYGSHRGHRRRSFLEELFD
jgi:Zn-finger nucleic acid-binding protein